MKYIMFKKYGKELNQFQPIIFGNHLNHCDVATCMTEDGAPLEGFEVRSAGEWNGFEACGSSQTLKVSSHPDDTSIILMHDYGAGFQ